MLNALQAENRRLRELLIRPGISLESAVPARLFTEEEKIRIFRSLFRGREDVYPIRWERADGRKGYSPRGERNWLAYNAARPEDRERIDRETKTYLPLTDQVVRAHLKGEITIGVYPLLQDESCWFLAADFDKSSWQEDTIAFLRTCTKNAVSAYLQISRAGKGGHIWIFFEQKAPATLARCFGAFLLTQTMESRHQIGLDSYDRFFPNQDTLPKGGFGNGHE